MFSLIFQFGTFMKPYTVKVWLAIVGTIPLVGMVTWIISNASGNHRSKMHERIKNIFYCMYYTFGALVGQGKRPIKNVGHFSSIHDHDSFQ